MIGFDFLNDCIIEIVVIIMDGRLNFVDGGISYIIKMFKEVLDKWVKWMFMCCCLLCDLN